MINTPMSAGITRLSTTMGIVLVLILLFDGATSLIGLRPPDAIPGSPNYRMQSQILSSANSKHSKKHQNTHRSLLHEFRCLVHILKSIIKSTTNSINIIEQKIRMCTENYTKEGESSTKYRCSQSLRTCANQASRNLLRERNCEPITRLSYCVADVSNKCFRKSIKAREILNRLKESCHKEYHSTRNQQ